MTRALGIGLWIALAVACGEPPQQQEVSLDHLEWVLSCDSSQFQQVPAHVPGHVLPALVTAGLVPNPNLKTHELDVQWVEHQTWTYRVHVPLPPGWEEGQGARLAFDGLDTYAHVFVNGEEVMSTNNAFRRWVSPQIRIPASGFLLEVLFDPVAQAGQVALDRHGLAIPAGNELKPVGSQTSPLTRKAGYQFGWDWGPRLAGPGIPGAVALHLESSKKEKHLVQPTCTVVVATEQEAQVEVRTYEGWSLEVSKDGEFVDWSQDGSSIRISEPELWWPVQMGDHPLYSFRWTHKETGKSFEHTLGIRTLDWEQIEDQWGTSFSPVVNGKRIFARGANVIPPDFHDVNSCDGWSSLVQNSLAANMNMVRVWGGGVYPPDCFFDACDRNGLLVWQDFMFACSMVPDDDEFASNVEKEAREHVFRLRHHPSLALWCGNNEVLRAWHQWGWQDLYNLHGADSTRLADAYDRIFHEVLPRAVSETCEVYYHPTSPTLDSKSGDEHAWHIWFGLENFDYYSRNSGRFVSEFGLQSLPDRHTLHEAGITAFEDEALQYRQRSKMEWLEPGFDGWDMMHHFMAKTTGAPEEGNLDDWIFRSQATQAEGLRQALERHRTSRGRYAGSLYWSLNDIWPAVSWSTVDYAGRWKLGHYAAKRANKALTAQWQRERQDSVILVAFNDSPSPFQGSLVVEVCTMNGSVLNGESTSLQLTAHSEFAWPAAAFEEWVETPEATYLAWSLLDGAGTVLERSTALWKAAVDSDLEPCHVEYERHEHGWTVTASSYSPVTYLTCSAPGHFSDNGMALEAGKPVEVAFTPESETTDVLDLQVRALNPSH